MIRQTVLALAVCSLVGLGVRAAEPKLSQEEAVAKIKKLGGSVVVDEQKVGKPVKAVYLEATRVTDKELVLLKSLPSVILLYLTKTQVGDAGLAHLKELKNLRTLILDQTKVGDAGLAHLKELKKLQSLYLRKTQVTKKGVDELKKALPELEIVTGE